MKYSYVIAILFALLMCGQAYGQTANQTDSLGRKQGLWIICNPIGHFIPNPGECNYGRYENGSKISSWHYTRIDGSLKRTERYSVRNVNCDSFQVENYHLNNVVESTGYEKMQILDSAVVINPENGIEEYRTIEVHRKHSIWSFYDDTGKLIKTVLYKDDKELSIH